MPVRSNTKKKKAFRLRPIVQGFFFLIFLYLFAALRYPFHSTFIDNLFFKFDPLIAIVLVLTGTTLSLVLLFSFLTILLTVLFGRVFCGWVCPMGTIFDLSAKIFPKTGHIGSYGNGRYKNIKYYILAFLLAGSVFGFTAVLFFDPLVFLYRVFTLNVHPFLVMTANAFLELFRPIATKLGWYSFSMLSLEQPVFVLDLTSLLLFSAVIGLIAVEHRFWCRNLCPLGALLSIFSRFSIRGRNISEACISCSRCARECPMNAISEDFKNTAKRECIQCETCAVVCPVDAITFGSTAPADGIAHNPGRRGLIAAGFGGLLAGLAAGTSAHTKTTARTLLRPPGALIEKDFLDSCLRCGECMKICPSNALQPAILQSGFEGFFTPVLTPRIGACEEQCNLCGRVCPTGAIRKLPLEEKQYAIIGNAAIERSLCIAWEQGKVCLICDEVCPYDAVEFHLVEDEKGAVKRPFVMEDKCVGCGQCENGCPVNGPAAIRITPVNEVRKNSGSYITGKVRKLREVDDDDTVDFSKELGKDPLQNEMYNQEEGQQENFDDDFNDLPAGFSR